MRFKLFLKKIKSKLYLILSGIAIGIVNGFFGGGGGMVCVPILEEILQIDNKKSHATALAVMLPIVVSSALIYLLRTPIDWYMFGFVVAGFILGGILGALLLRKLRGKIVRIIFILIIFSAGVKMLI
jgi:uncharacterized membrane protein YfcA